MIEVPIGGFNMKLYKLSTGDYIPAKNIQDALRQITSDNIQMWASECKVPSDFETNNKGLVSALLSAFSKARTLKEFKCTTPVMVQYKPANGSMTIRKLVMLPAGQPIYKAVPVDAKKASVRVAEDEFKQLKVSSADPYIQAVVAAWLGGKPRQPRH